MDATRESDVRSVCSVFLKVSYKSFYKILADVQRRAGPSAKADTCITNCCLVRRKASERPEAK